jgi:hypothetical protein
MRVSNFIPVLFVLLIISALHFLLQLKRRCCRCFLKPGHWPGATRQGSWCDVSSSFGRRLTSYGATSKALPLKFKGYIAAADNENVNEDGALPVCLLATAHCARASEAERLPTNK